MVLFCDGWDFGHDWYRTIVHKNSLSSRVVSRVRGSCYGFNNSTIWCPLKSEGYDYKSQYNLAVHDLTVSPDDFAAMNNIAQYLEDNGKFQEAIKYARQSINIYPIVSNYNNLGLHYSRRGITGAQLMQIIKP